jgi:hydroxymethylglutaryl-CoA lyase
MSDLPSRIHIMEVGLRDGLQIEPKILTVDEKLQLIEAITSAGVEEIEVGAFVNPRAVPQMANTEELLGRLKRRKGKLYRVLFLNQRGLDQAIANGKADLRGMVHVSGSDTFSIRNSNRSIAETLAEMPDWVKRFQAAGLEVDQMGVFPAFGCNFEGDLPAEQVVRLVAALEEILLSHGSTPSSLTLADTTGFANPLQVKRVVGRVQDRWPNLKLKLHLHDTRGTGLANAFAALEMGVSEFDSSIGGLGGCPFAGHRGAAGNICTEDLVFLAEEMGIDTGIDLDALIEAARLLEQVLGRPLPGKVMKGGSLSHLRTA